eukprot:CAMPEP_0185857144 /NCGR_PEP_ID=MMETSP1354-20130828/29355_1 /TAXON_ID=708628 /ORGANISM="Erythrolobus madagascarensis, Strain CCMP3276" /LENGTH=777 /DNA_ID=CAMNT_0028559411 /DNA_START=296 /DNA_END=2629 /DNA_ORIENTATION=+
MSGGANRLVQGISIGSVAQAAPLEQNMSLPKRPPVFLSDLPHAHDVLRVNPNAAIRQDTPDETVFSSTSTIEITFDGVPGPSFALGVKIGMQIVADFWESEVPVRVLVSFKTNPSFDFIGFATALSVFEVDGLLMPIASAEAVLGRGDLNPGSFDIQVDINLQREWFTARTGSPPSNEFDLPSVVIHEMMHGLFFTGNLGVEFDDTDGNVGFVRGGRLTAYDAYVGLRAEETEEEECAFYGYLGDNLESKSTELARALTSNRASFLRVLDVGTIENAIYAPSDFATGSSIVHFDVTIESFDQCDVLMSFVITAGQSIRCVGPVTNNVRSTILRAPQFTPPPCAPGTFRFGEDDSTVSDGTIGGLPRTTFIAVVAASGAVVVLLVALLVWWCVRSAKESTKRVKPSGYGYNSPGGYVSTGHISPFAGSQYGDGGYMSPGGFNAAGGSPRGYKSGHLRAMSPGAMSPGIQPSARLAAHNISSAPGSPRGAVSGRMSPRGSVMPAGPPQAGSGRINSPPIRPPQAPLAPARSPGGSGRLSPIGAQLASGMPAPRSPHSTSGRMSPGAPAGTRSPGTSGREQPPIRPPSGVGAGGTRTPGRITPSPSSPKIRPPAGQGSAKMSPGPSSPRIRPPPGQGSGKLSPGPSSPRIRPPPGQSSGPRIAPSASSPGIRSPPGQGSGRIAPAGAASPTPGSPRMIRPPQSQGSNRITPRASSPAVTSAQRVASPPTAPKPVSPPPVVRPPQNPPTAVTSAQRVASPPTAPKPVSPPPVVRPPQNPPK